MSQHRCHKPLFLCYKVIMCLALWKKRSNSTFLIHSLLKRDLIRPKKLNRLKLKLQPRQGSKQSQNNQEWLCRLSAETILLWEHILLENVHTNTERGNRSQSPSEGISIRRNLLCSHSNTNFTHPLPLTLCYSLCSHSILALPSHIGE